MRRNQVAVVGAAATGHLDRVGLLGAVAGAATSTSTTTPRTARAAADVVGAMLTRWHYAAIAIPLTHTRAAITIPTHARLIALSFSSPHS